MLVYGKCECFVRQMLYVCVLCASCGRSQCFVPHDLQFVNAGRGCKRRPYGRGIIQSWSHNCFVCSHECLPRAPIYREMKAVCIHTRTHSNPADLWCSDGLKEAHF